VPGIDKHVERKTDTDGLFELVEAKAAGIYGIRAALIEPKEGERDGKKYKEVRHYATAAFATPVKKEAPKAKHDGGLTAAAGGETKPVEDPAATKLLADARAARAVWKDFPGFSADVAVNHDGTVHKGHVEISPQGKVTLKLDASEELQTWTRGEI